MALVAAAVVFIARFLSLLSVAQRLAGVLVVSNRDVGPLLGFVSGEPAAVESGGVFDWPGVADVRPSPEVPESLSECK